MPSNGESLDGDIISALVGQAAERRLALRIGDSTEEVVYSIINLSWWEWGSPEGFGS